MKIKKIISKTKTLIFLVSAGALLVLSASPALAQNNDIQDNLCKGANFTTEDTGCGADLDIATDQVSEIITNGINLFSLIIGVIAVVMIMVGGV